MTARVFIVLAATGATLALAAGAAEAQGVHAAAQRRLQQSLDASTYRAVNVVFDSARARGVPVEPLVNKALQATLHRTPGPRVRDAVSAYAGRLEVAKHALGHASTEAEITAGANALAVGVPRETLVTIRALSGSQPVTLALGVLTELVAREVAVGHAAAMVVALLRNGATPAQLVSLSRDVARDVDGGIEAGAAFDIRTRGVLAGPGGMQGGDLLQATPVPATTTERAGPAETSKPRRTP